MAIAHDRPGARRCSHRRYYLSCEEYDDLRARAAGRCQLCGQPEARETYRVLCVDHDPLVGLWAVRGLLCSRCNSGLHQRSTAGRTRDRYLADPWYAQVGKSGPGERVPVDALDQATARYREMEKAREDVVTAVVVALKAGATPTEVTARSPFTAAHVRNLAREHGIPPARPGIKPAKK